jgi:hypothetical protein
MGVPWFLVGLLLPPAAAAGWGLIIARRVRPAPFLTGWLCSATGGTVVSLLQHEWWPAAGYAISGAVGIAVWWWRRKKRRPVAKLIGAKSRQIRDAIVRRAREAARPRPVLSPAPGGVR